MTLTIRLRYLFRHLEDISSRKLTLSRYPSYCSVAYFLQLPVVGSSDRSKSGRAGLLLSRLFFLYLFRRLGVSSKRIVKEATLCSLLAFEQICFSVQVSDLSARDIVVVIVAQKVKDSCIEDERQYRTPHLPAGLLIPVMSRVGSSNVS
ncbi:hypothetical protein F511_10045 [Dorcoceras hygrometricum]|uniref:Uncharacterized protein n=1 Tax=Dorcoceras hygrometricum TaxID=472368 RepID=A0A2Z7AIX3_9LAMI|nr:hypothetical protein F511_10045 [Dorcoceras hygrometricum]